MWFDSWSQILRVLVIGTVSYTALVGLLRVSGKRTLGQLNAFDFIITVAFGSTLATIVLSSDVAFFEGLPALALLVGLQFLIAWASAHVPGARAAITARCPDSFSMPSCAGTASASPRCCRPSGPPGPGT